MSQTDEVREQVEFNLDKKVTVKSIANWPVTFYKKHDDQYAATVTPGGTIRLSRSEIIAQVNSGNKLFAGIHGNGDHATLYIDDAPTRVELGFESADGSTKQMIFTEDAVKALFATKSNAAFEKGFVEMIRTRAEKLAVMEAIKRLGINDYSRIRFAENHTGYTLS